VIRRHRVFAGGALVVVAYLVAVGATVGVGGHGVRPLYDSLTPPPAYKWVNPPRLFKTANKKPSAISELITPLGPASAATSVATSDSQAILDLPQGAVPTHGTDTSATVTLTPVDPAKLGSLPAGRYPYGNAYRVTIIDHPSGSAVATVGSAGDLILASPAVGHYLYTSANGTTWTSVTARLFPPTNLLVGAAFTSAGYYVVAGTVPVAGGGTTSSSGNSLLLGVVAAVIAVILLASSVIVSRRRRRA
jgi:hypothetical protein